MTPGRQECGCGYIVNATTVGRVHRILPFTLARDLVEFCNTLHNKVESLNWTVYNAHRRCPFPILKLRAQVECTNFPSLHLQLIPTCARKCTVMIESFAVMIFDFSVNKESSPISHHFISFSFIST